MKNKTRKLIIVSIIFLIVFGIILGGYIAAVRANKNVVRDAELTLLASAKEQIKTFETTIISQLQVLNSIAATIPVYERISYSEVSSYLASITTTMDASILQYILPNGMPCDGVNTIDFSGNHAFLRALNGHATAAALDGSENGEFGITIFAPVKNDSGNVVGVLRSVYSDETLRSVFTSEVYEGAGNSFIISANGCVIIGDDSGEHSPGDNNIFEKMNSLVFEKGYSAHGIQRDLTDGMLGTAVYSKQDGENMIAAYMPIKLDELIDERWYIFNLVEKDELTLNTLKSWRDSMVTLSIFGFFALCSVVLFVFLERDTKRKIDAETSKLKQSELQYRIVAKQGTRSVFRYDIASDTAFHSADSPDVFGGNPVCKSPDRFSVNSGLVAAESSNDICDFYSRIRNGESPLFADILMCDSSGKQRWFRFDSTTTFSDIGKPAVAIISYYDCTEQREREQAYAKWQQELSEMNGDDIALFEWNLTRELLEATRGGLADSFCDLPETSFDAFCSAYAEQSVFEDDRLKLCTALLRERLIGAYHDEVFHDSIDYRELLNDGEMCWMNITVQLVPYLDSNDIKAYIAVKNIDKQKKEELLLIARSQLDSMTGLYNRETFIHLVNDVIRERPDGNHAIFMIDLDRFKNVNDRFGHEAGDKTLVDVANVIRSVMRVGDVIGRVGGDEFMVCLPDIMFDGAISKRAEALCAAISSVSPEGIGMTASVGISVYPRDGLQFDELYRRADAAQYYVKNNIKNSFSFFRDGMATDTLHTNSEIEHEGVENSSAILSSVIIACNDEDLTLRLKNAIDSSFSVVVADNVNALYQNMQNRIAMPTVIIVDGDGAFGDRVFTELQSDMRRNSFPIFVLAESVSDVLLQKMADISTSILIPKRSIEEILPIRLRSTYSHWYLEQRRIQQEYYRLQTIDEMRYREVLRATATTVFLYDVETGTYKTDLLPNGIDREIFTGANLGDGLCARGAMSRQDLEHCRELIRKVACGEEEHALMYAMMEIKQGKTKWYMIQISQMKNIDTLTPKLIITVNDVDERINAEEQRKRLLDNLPCGAAMYEVGDNGVSIIHINKRYKELVGRDDDEIYKSSAVLAVLPSERQKLAEHISAVVNDKKVHSCNLHIINGEGKYIPFKLVGRTVDNDEKKIIYTTYTPIDSTEMSMEQMLPIALSAMMSSSADYMFVKNRDLVYICASSAFAAVTKLGNEKDIVGKTDYDLFDDVLAEKYRADDKKLIDSGVSLVEYVEPIPDIDGTKRFVITSKYLLYDDEGNVIGLYGISRDITRRIENQRLQTIIGLVVQSAFEYVYTIHTDTGRYELFGNKARNIAKTGDYNEITHDISRQISDDSARSEYLANSSLDNIIAKMTETDGHYHFRYDKNDGTYETYFYYYEAEKIELVATVHKVMPTH